MCRLSEVESNQIKSSGDIVKKVKKSCSSPSYINIGCDKVIWRSGGGPRSCADSQKSNQIKLNPLGISSKGKEKLLFPLIYQEED